MADPFLAEIRIFAGNFAPRGWAFCAGQLMPISQNTALFSLLGTMYGGDGKATFALPDLQGRVPVHANNQDQWFQGSPGGSPTVTLLTSEIANHTHTVNVATADPATLTAPGPDRVVAQSSGGNAYRTTVPADRRVLLAVETISMGGGGQAHTNLQPMLVLNHIIALQGVYPPRP